MSRPQKNNGKRGSRNEDGNAKSNATIRNLLTDLSEEGRVDDVHVARVLKMIGNGRLEAFFVTTDDNNIVRPCTAQAMIRGTFRGKSKRSAWIEANTFVVISDSKIEGPGRYSVIGIITRDDMKQIRGLVDIDPRVLAVTITDSAQLMSAKTVVEEEAFVFEDDEALPELEGGAGQVVSKSERKSKHVARILKADVEELTEKDIDNI
jgi:hypothetical protein